MKTDMRVLETHVTLLFYSLFCLLGPFSGSVKELDCHFYRLSSGFIFVQGVFSLTVLYSILDVKYKYHFKSFGHKLILVEILLLRQKFCDPIIHATTNHFNGMIGIESSIKAGHGEQQ